MKKGLTLAEVLLGMAILTFAFVAILALFANCIILNESNRNLTIAVSHTQFVMEEIKNTDFSSIGSEVWNWESRDDLTPLTNESIVISVDDTDSELLDVTVTTTWDNRGGRTRNISLQTLITEP